MPGPEAALSHPLCLSWSLGCQMGTGMVKDLFGLAQGWPWAGLSCRIPG